MAPSNVLKLRDLKRLLAVFASLLLLWLGAVPATLPAAEAKETMYQIQAVKVDPSGNLVTIQGNQRLGSAGAFSTLKLPSPYRLVIDFPNAMLASPTPPTPVNRNGIREIELSESRGTFYSSARITVFVENRDVLDRLQASVVNGTLTLTQGKPALGQSVATGPVPQQERPRERQFVPQQPDRQATATVPVPRETSGFNFEIPSGRSLIQDIQFRNDQLVIRADDGASLRIKNRLVLKDPQRLVLDIDNAVVADKRLLGPVSGSSSAMRNIRVGQFDEETVRVVVETSVPEQLHAVFSGTGRKLLTIRQDIGGGPGTLPSDVQVGRLQRVIVGKQHGNDTVIRLSTSVPMVHRIVKYNDQVTVELLNIQARPGELEFNRGEFGEQIKDMRMERLSLEEPTSKLVIQLASENAQISNRLMPDGETLELYLMSPMLNRAVVAKGERAPFSARVVIDAGHGGKDMGANRVGILEKDLNLSVALKLKEALEARGVKVYMTRDTDVFLPLPSITAITNRIGPDLFVSVHTNSSTNPAITGIETYYYTPQSLSLARHVHRNMVNSIASPDRGVRKAMFYVIHHTSVPAILCEMGYVSNAEERSSLVTESRKQKTADAIADGIVSYLKSSVSAKAK
jgi:N-acetylmuramoyl-L-alanine amidase